MIRIQEIVIATWASLAALGLLQRVSVASDSRPYLAQDSRLEDARLAESWEGDRERRPNPQACAPLNEALVIPVPEIVRREAIARLEVDPVVALDQQKAAHSLQRQNPESRTLASEVMESAVAELEHRRRRALTERIGSWSMAGQEQLDELTRFVETGTSLTLQPFLVRAVAKNESTGAFVANICGETLLITHWSLGHETPPSIPHPVVVFLDQAPAMVHADWGMAE
jgi:hypothetical protein